MHERNLLRSSFDQYTCFFKQTCTVSTLLYIKETRYIIVAIRKFPFKEDIMVDSISGLAVTQLKNAHNYAKSIQVANFGKYYASFADSVDYYGTELVVKPILRNTPDWVADNRVVTAMQNNRVATILGSTALVLLFLILIHPNREPVDLTKKTDPAAGSGAVNGTEDPEESDKDSDAGSNASNVSEDESDAPLTDPSAAAAAAAATTAAATAAAASAPPPTSSSSSAAGAGGGNNPV
jgi:hypothetical protein